MKLIQQRNKKLFLYSKGDNKSRYLLDFGELTITVWIFSLSAALAQDISLKAKKSSLNWYQTDYEMVSGARKHSSMIKCRLHICRLSHLILFLIALILSEPLCRDNYLWRC